MSDNNVERKKITDFEQDNANANQGTERGLRMLDDSLNSVGLGRSIVVDKHGRIIAGNKTTERAVDSGFEDAIVVKTDGKQLVVVQRDDLDLYDNDPDNPARKLAYYDNRVGQLDLQWDSEQLFKDKQAGFNLAPLFSEQEQAELFADMDTGEAQDAPEAQIDRAEELNEIWQVKTGDLWQIGTHRLLCGDSTNADDVARLMGGEKAEMCFTSPPYNVAAKSSLPNKDKYTGHSDDLSDSAYLSFLVEFIRLSLGVSEYCFVNIQSVAGNKLALIDLLHHFREQYADTIIWDKQVSEPAMSPKVLNSQFEYIHIFSKYANRAIGCKDFRGTVSNVLNLNSRQDKEFSDIHKATYPIELASWGVDNFTNGNGVTYDPFGGSGTTMVACEQLGRYCRMMELHPPYCAVILQRMADMGLEPERLN